jgi:hypothetical protein
MSEEPLTHIERLFAAEAELRRAAAFLAAGSNNDTRRGLRTAALAYASAAVEIDEAVENLRNEDYPK